ncbi:histidine phosphatase family protein [Candidatus Amarolinea dominans]|uniref:histidine phosphatase family protein n=1 Tax=Candidatus Amarolinea dominans TaxID=3140696 RepID=UPI003135BBC8|nr:histidine phosphatase family protein [Anaerolineae bacterium]
MSSELTTIWLLRHGQSQWNHEGRWQGQADIQLSELGRQQAHRVGQRLRRYQIEHLISSDATRALETAQVVGSYLHLTPTPHAGLRESDIGAWTGLTSAEIKARFPEEWAAMNARADVARGGGETYSELRSRTWAVAQEAVARHHGRAVLLVSHGTAIRALISAALGLDVFTMHNLWIGGNTALSRLRFRDGRFHLDLHNDTAHLEEAEA